MIDDEARRAADVMEGALPTGGNDMATWRGLISYEMERREDSWANVAGCTLTDAELDVEFDAGFGWSQGAPFTLWTTDRVYFPVVYDGGEWVGCAPRNPCDESTGHQGGQ